MVDVPRARNHDLRKRMLIFIVQGNFCENSLPTNLVFPVYSNVHFYLAASNNIPNQLYF
ncbi:hypothetical protein BYT27DRAFT_7189057 [Phlegmacium glaucopus]|nr:hypothetical protein BYT27DRAFT_7189057 [Phlegmacium glaucopus]